MRICTKVASEFRKPDIPNRNPELNNWLNASFCVKESRILNALPPSRHCAAGGLQLAAEADRILIGGNKLDYFLTEEQQMIQELTAPDRQGKNPACQSGTGRKRGIPLGNNEDPGPGGPFRPIYP